MQILCSRRKKGEQLPRVHVESTLNFSTEGKATETSQLLNKENLNQSCLIAAYEVLVQGLVDLFNCVNQGKLLCGVASRPAALVSDSSSTPAPVVSSIEKLPN